MSEAKVTIKEIDLSTRVPSFPGVTGAICLPALKGPVDQPVFITNDTQLLSVFTPDSKVDVGMSLGFYSALAYLQKSDKLWVQRVANAPLYAGLALKTSSSSYSNAAFPAGVTDPSAYVFDGMPDVDAVAEVTSETFSQSGSFYDVSGSAKYLSLYATASAQHYFWFNVTDGSNVQTDPAVVGATGHQVNVLSADTSAQVAGKFQTVAAALNTLFTATVLSSVVTTTNVTEGSVPDATASGTAAAVLVTTQGVDEVDQTDEAVAIFANSPGAYGNDIAIKVIVDPLVVKEPNAFIIQVFKLGNLSTPIEPNWVVSRTPGAKDGFGNNMFIEDKLQGSNYIRGLSNPAVTDTILPKVQSSALFLESGSNGSAVSDTQMVAALDTFRNPDDLFFAVLMDGGWATPAFALAADDVVSSRQDSVSIVSTPYSAEADSDYITALLDYRKTDLNLSSSYSALYTPHVKIQDKFNDRVLFVAPDGYAAAAISASASNFEIWFPPAGNKRGKVNVLDIRRRFSSGELAILSDSQINPLKFTPGKGIRIWGQSTLLASPSKLQELNIRLLLITIEPALKAGLEDFLFDLNDDSTRARASGVVEKFMEPIKSRRGVSAFRVVCDLSNNSDQDISAGRLILHLFTIPTGAVKEIAVSVIITNEGVQFETLNV